MLSVIIPTYNRAEYLPAALHSLANQETTDQEVEVVVVDDGSTDNTAQVAKDFANQLDIKYFKQSHQGVSAARNLGLARARGEVLVFFDDDAAADRRWLKNISAITKQEAAITGQVKPLTAGPWNYFAPHYYQGESPRESPVLLEGNCALRREVFEAVGPFDANLDYGHEGEEFIARCRQKYSVKYYPEMIIYHDYAFGLKNYLAKQAKFGEKMVYLNQQKIKSFWQLLKNHDQLKSGGAASSFPVNPEAPSPTLKLKIIGRLGRYSYLLGAGRGYFKYLAKN